MLAIAKSQGFYAGKRIRSGEFFEVADGAKGAWFDIVDGAKPAKSSKKQAAAKEPETFSELNAETESAEAAALAGKVEEEQA